MPKQYLVSGVRCLNNTAENRVSNYYAPGFGEPLQSGRDPGVLQTAPKSWGLVVAEVSE